jgi:hypothetical protein
MAISRANMNQQITKPENEDGLGKQLLRGAMPLIPRMMAEKGESVLGGLIPQLIGSAKKRGNPVSVSIEVEEEGSEDDEVPESYRQGGYTGKGRDGCAVRGKTKGRCV